MIEVENLCLHQGHELIIINKTPSTVNVKTIIQNLENKHKSLSIKHINIRYLNRNFNKLYTYQYTDTPAIICLFEICGDDESSPINIANYSFICDSCSTRRVMGCKNKNCTLFLCANLICPKN